MIKPFGVFVSIIFLLLVLSGAGLVPAQSGLRVLDSSVEVEFPTQLRFNLSAESGVNIKDVRLHYATERESYAQIISEVYIDFAPDTTIEVNWTWDMRRTGELPPGSSVEYWWTIEDVSGSQAETIPVRFQFDDSRYAWQSLAEGKVTLYWYEGGQAFAGKLMSATQQVLAQLAEETGAYLTRPIRIYVYANARDLQGAMIFPQKWTGGATYTRYSIIAIGIAPNRLDWGKRAIAHELTHLVIHQMTFNPYNDLPAWLDEGLAMYAEGALSDELSKYLDRAVAEDRLISARSLSSPFSAYAVPAYLAYAQSYSLVEFLISRYGQGKMLTLLDTFKEGSGYDAALEEVYSFDMDELNTLWQDYVVKHYQDAKVKTTAMSPAVIGVLTGQTGSSDSLCDILIR